MTQFRNWYVRNQDSITWFIIGWLTLSGIENLIDGKYIGAAIDAAIIFVNVKLSGFNMQ